MFYIKEVAHINFEFLILNFEFIYMYLCSQNK